ncbi:MAG: hypothetical protein AB1938_31430 [Myxococcota bacterium]
MGDAGASVGVDKFGASAPDKILYEQYGLTVPAIVAAVRRVAGK